MTRPLVLLPTLVLPLHADLLEYALVGDPTDPADHPGPVLDPSGYSFRYDATRTDVEWIVETSVDLTGWMQAATIRAGGLPDDIAAGFLVETDGGTPEILTISGAFPSSEPHSFIRLRVRQLP